VAALGALQAQDYRQALWAIGVRLPSATEADVERAIAERTIARSWLMRGTLHFVAAADLRWMLRLFAPRVVAATARRWRQLGLDDAQFARSGMLLTGALQGERSLTRDQAFTTLEHGGVSTAGQRGIHILRALALDGLLCFAAHHGRQPAFALLEEWLPPAPQLAREEALAELASRYFGGHGPATLKDFAWWAGLTLADARIGLAAAKHDLEQATIGGAEYWVPASAPVPSTQGGSDATTVGGEERGVHLLPGFDEYVIGYTDRSLALDDGALRRIVPGGNGVFLPTVVFDGRVVGTWRRVNKPGHVRVSESLFEPLTGARRSELQTAAARYAAFLGAELMTG
jgi:hypothetical protein